MNSVFRLLLLAVVCLALSGAPRVACAEGGGHGGGEAHGGESKKKGKEDSDISGGRFDGDPIYVHMQPIIMPVITNEGAQQLVTMLVDIQIKDFETATKMHETMPRLKDAVLQAVYGGLSDGSLRNGGALDLVRIKKKIQGETNRLFGQDAVIDVFIQAVAQRKF